MSSPSPLTEVQCTQRPQVANVPGFRCAQPGLRLLLVMRAARPPASVHMRLIHEADWCTIATLTGEHAGALGLIADSFPNSLIGRESFHLSSCWQRGLLPVVVGALQPRSQCGART
jgi:hypothetical protein